MSHTSLTAIAFLPFVVLLNSPAPSVQGISEQAVVDSLYPAARLQPKLTADRRSCYQVAVVAADGTPTRLVAGYTDTVEAVLRVLDRNPSGSFDFPTSRP